MTDKSQATLRDGRKSKEEQWETGGWQVPSKGVPHPAPWVTVPVVGSFTLSPKPTFTALVVILKHTPLVSWLDFSSISTGHWERMQPVFLVPVMLLPCLVRQHSMVSAQVVLTFSQIQWYQPCKQISEEFHRAAPTSGTSPGPTEGSSQHIILTCCFPAGPKHRISEHFSGFSSEVWTSSQDRVSSFIFFFLSWVFFFSPINNDFPVCSYSL